MSSIELQRIESRDTAQGFNSGPEDAPDSAIFSALPPVDRGRQAWSFLAAATVMELLVWGLPFSVGVLHSYWSDTLFPEGTPGRDLLALSATLQTGLMYLLVTFFGPLLRQYPHHRLQMQVVGLVSAFVGILGAAFASKPWHLLVTLGLLYPVCAVYYLPAATLLFEWFNAKRGLASGILFAGTGIGGTVFPFIMQALLTRFSYRASMVALALGFGVLGALCLPFIKPRVPVAPRGSVEAARARRVDTAFLKRTPFYAFGASILFSSLGNFIPSVWIPSFAADLGYPESTGTMLISVMNAASVPGLLVMGYLSDVWPMRVVITISCLGSALSCLFLWGFATSSASLVIFVVCFGALGLSFSALWTQLIALIALDDASLPPVIFSIFAFARGVGNITSGPVANALLASNLLGGAKGGYGVKNYGSLMLYSGLTMMLGSCVGVLYRTPKKLAHD